MKFGAGCLKQRSAAVLNRHPLGTSIEQVKLVAHLVGGQLLFLGGGNSRRTTVEENVSWILDSASG